MLPFFSSPKDVNTDSILCAIVKRVGLPDLISETPSSNLDCLDFYRKAGSKPPACLVNCIVTQAAAARATQDEAIASKCQVARLVALQQTRQVIGSRRTLEAATHFYKDLRLSPPPELVEEVALTQAYMALHGRDGLLPASGGGVVATEDMDDDDEL